MYKFLSKEERLQLLEIEVLRIRRNFLLIQIFQIQAFITFTIRKLLNEYTSPTNRPKTSKTNITLAHATNRSPLSRTRFVYTILNKRTLELTRVRSQVCASCLRPLSFPPFLFLFILHPPLSYFFPLSTYASNVIREDYAAK